MVSLVGSAPPILEQTFRSAGTRPFVRRDRTYRRVVATARRQAGTGRWRHRLAAGAFALIAATLLVGIWTSPASAHAELVTATPDAGSGLPQAPGYVVLKFSEPLNDQLSHIEILDQRARDVGVGATVGVVGDRAAMRRKLGLLQPDTYTVRWTTVSFVDGHTLKGSYQFGIGDAPLGNEHVASSPISSEGWLGLIGSFVAFVGLSFWAGALLLGGVARRAGLPDSLLQRALLFGPILALVGAFAWVASSAIVASGARFDLAGVLTSSRSGRWRLLVLAAAAIGTLLSLGSHRWAQIDKRGLRVVSGGLAAAAVVGLAASGHAGATAAPTLATAVLAVHLLAVGVWLFALASAVLSTARLRTVLATFAPYAIAAAAAVALTGVVSAILELNDVAELFTTGYGKVIVFKASALLVMAVLGFTHNRWRQTPTRDAPSIRDLVIGELGAGTIALILAVVLVAFPNPPREDAIAEQLANSSPTEQATRQPALSLADASGPFIVGLTLSPPQPGTVSVRLQVIGVEAGDGLRDASVHATSDRGLVRDIALHDCGLGCLEGSGSLDQAATWQLRTNITSNRGPIQTTATIPLPAPNGSTALQHAVSAMDHLQSAQLHEELRGDLTSPPVVTDYTFRAPDAFTFSIAGGAQSVTIGRQRYSRDNATAPWTLQTSPPGAGLSFAWPKGYYTDFWAKPAATRVIGTTTVDGIPSQIVAFVRPDLPAWFRLWIGTEDGLVRRMEMRAEGHLMNHHYTGFNEPVTITPPTQ